MKSSKPVHKISYDIILWRLAAALQVVSTLPTLIFGVVPN
jgi:hypothetical protein